MATPATPDTDPPIVALVDDDQNILASVSMGLKAQGYAVRVYADPQAALRALTDNPPDIAVLDVKMPRLDGLGLLARLRETSALPVIFLTSVDDEAGEAEGLAAGADDYITKPFSQRLLVARIEAVLRRARARAAPAGAASGPAPPAAPLVRGRLTLDPERHRVTWDGHDIVLTVTEFLILETLAQRPGVVRSRDQLMDHAYSEDSFVDDRTIDSHIKRMRRKFREADPQFRGIETLYGVGYRLDPD
jgi:two-component system response regulator ChvI